MQIETVKISAPVTDDNPLGYVVINKSDLLPEHDLFKPASKAVEAPRKAPSAD